MVTTTLNLPPGETEITLQSHSAISETPNPQPLSSGPPKTPRTSSYTGAKRPPSNRPPSRPPSNGQSNGYRDPRKSYDRRTSKSPNSKDPKKDRGRSPGVTSRPQSRSGSSAAYIAEIDTLQYYSIHSKSPNPNRKFSMPSMFRRPLTPKTYSHLKTSYFYKTSADKFANVLKDGRCLRCWSKSHRASACPSIPSLPPTHVGIATTYIIQQRHVGSMIRKGRADHPLQPGNDYLPQKVTHQRLLL